MTITTRRNSADTTDSPEVERVHLKKIVSQLKNNLYNVSVLSEPDLEMITNMDPNSVADITGKDFIEQLKEVSGRLGGGKSNLSWDLSPYIFHLHCIWCVAKNHFVSYFPLFFAFDLCVDGLNQKKIPQAFDSNKKAKSTFDAIESMSPTRHAIYRICVFRCGFWDRVGCCLCQFEWRRARRLEW